MVTQYNLLERKIKETNYEEIPELHREKIRKKDREILSLFEKLKNIKGTQTEVYSRIVGYYRNIRDWNVGKKEEYKYRKSFLQPDQDTLLKYKRNSSLESIKV